MYRDDNDFHCEASITQLSCMSSTQCWALCLDTSSCAGKPYQSSCIVPGGNRTWQCWWVWGASLGSLCCSLLTWCKQLFWGSRKTNLFWQCTRNCEILLEDSGLCYASHWLIRRKARNCFNCNSAQVSLTLHNLTQKWRHWKKFLWHQWVHSPCPHMRVTSPPLLNRYHYSLNWSYSAFWSSPVITLFSSSSKHNLLFILSDLGRNYYLRSTKLWLFLRIVWSLIYLNKVGSRESLLWSHAFHTWSVNIQVLIHMNCLLMVKLLHLQNTHIHSQT